MSITYVKNLGWTYVILGVITLTLMIIAGTPWIITASIAAWIIGLGAMQVALAHIARRRNQRAVHQPDPDHDDEQDGDHGIVVHWPEFERYRARR